ncbi:hypothetical protein [Mesoplasma florum]|uniref:hypothetical protein n=1 Tax=Mesoplasma florum TaxID=2151 RepID=UPI000D0314DE|nr:hypothetical protein [Mesoplasma florum]AVN59056.1 hypothetical protein CG009_02380 [Mesoplasma florum]
MKKLLATFSAIGLTSLSATTLVSCSTPSVVETTDKDGAYVSFTQDNQAQQLNFEVGQYNADAEILLYADDDYSRYLDITTTTPKQSNKIMSVNIKTKDVSDEKWNFTMAYYDSKNNKTISEYKFVVEMKKPSFTIVKKTPITKYIKDNVEYILQYHGDATKSGLEYRLNNNSGIPAGVARFKVIEFDVLSKENKMADVKYTIEIIVKPNYILESKNVIEDRWKFNLFG